MHSVVTEDGHKKGEEGKSNLHSAVERYPSWFFKQVKEKISSKQKQVTSKKPENDNKTKYLVIIPYVEGLSQKVKRIFMKHGVSTAMRPNTTLRKLLVHPKDKRDLLIAPQTA